VVVLREGTGETQQQEDNDRQEGQEPGLFRAVLDVGVEMLVVVVGVGRETKKSV
jgi:hypothetical protein